jgi:hypothetical protein
MPAVVVIVALTLVSGACGTTATAPQSTSGPAATSMTPSSPGIPSTTPSPSRSWLPPAAAASGLVVPDGAGYDVGLGGRYQLITWTLGKDGRTVFLLLAAAPDAARAKYVAAKASPPGYLDLNLRDTRPQESSPGHVAGSASGAISSAKLVFPPDDALVVLRLAIRSSQPAQATIASQVGQGDLFVVTVKVKG